MRLFYVIKNNLAYLQEWNHQATQQAKKKSKSRALVFIQQRVYIEISHGWEDSSPEGSGLGAVVPPPVEALAVAGVVNPLAPSMWSPAVVEVS